MERYKNNDFSGDWYVFDGQFILIIGEDYINVSSISPLFRERKTSDPRYGPFIYINYVGAYLLRRIIQEQKFPIKLYFSGDSVGSLKECHGYDAVVCDPQERKLTSVTIDVDMNSKFFGIKISGQASHVVQRKQYLEDSLSEKDWLPMPLSYNFKIPIEDVPELLNMNETQRRLLRGILARMNKETQLFITSFLK